MAVNSLIAVLGVLALAGAGIGMATLAAGPFGMSGGGCSAGKGGCPSYGGGSCPGGAPGQTCKTGNCNQTNPACPGLQDGTCPAYNGTDGS